MINLICLDRDGTVNEDHNYYLGSSPDWKSEVRILEGVVEGIRKLNSRPNTEVFIVTNQAGVALNGEEFAELTEERMHEVNQHILNRLSSDGAFVRGYFACPFVSRDYARKALEKGRRVNPDYVVDYHPDLKPNIGMLEKCAHALGVNLCDTNLFVIGDRATDVHLGLNGNGYGVLVQSQKTRELGDVNKVVSLREKYDSRVYIARDFLDAVEFVSERIVVL